MPGIPALQLRGFAELDRARLVSALRAKRSHLRGQTLLQNKTGKAYEAETKTKTNVADYSLAAIIPQQKSPLQIGLSLSLPII